MKLLNAEGITKRFSGIRALDAVDLDVEIGEIVGLIGPNGAGKTTLFNCLSGVIRPDEGWITFDGHRVTRLSVHRRARLGLGRTFQRMELFGGMTVRDHLLVAGRAHQGSPSLARDLIGRSRPSADQADRADQLLGTLGLGLEADRPIESLSLGQGRLVELGRALMTEPKLLFLDEPSSGLDRDETNEMVEVLTNVHHEHDTAILLVEHDIPMVQKLATRLYVLDYGTVIATGPAEEVMADPAVRRAYLGVDA